MISSNLPSTISVNFLLSTSRWLSIGKLRESSISLFSVNAHAYFNFIFSASSSSICNDAISFVILLPPNGMTARWRRSEEHTSELQSRDHLVCRLLLEEKKTARNFSQIRKYYSRVRSSRGTRRRS